MEDRAALAANEARALFQFARRGEPGADESCGLAIIGENAEILYASPAAMRLFEAEGRTDLQRALGAGESPNARRLRRLAASLPIGGPPRLERMRFILGRRSTSLNLLCARVPSLSGGTVLALSMPEPDNRELLAGPDARPAGRAIHAEPGSGGDSVDAVADRVSRAQRARRQGRKPGNLPSEPRNARFLWTLDSNGRFGTVDPALISALGAAAPEPGETLEGLRLRAEIEHADELAGLIDKRETFSDLALVWRRSGEDRKLRVTLSAAPTFDSRRDFAGYCGFGVLHEAIGVDCGADEADQGSDLERVALGPLRRS